jgi:hypothetical protein
LEREDFKNIVHKACEAPCTEVKSIDVW